MAKNKTVEISKIRKWRDNRIKNYGNNETLEALLYMIWKWESRK